MEFAKEGYDMTGLLLASDNARRDILAAQDLGDQILRQSHEEGIVYVKPIRDTRA